MKNYLSILLLSFAGLCLQAQDLSRDEYIKKYYLLAIEEMQNYGIPASITLSQALLESANGNSYLATEGRNHFGIKCHDWTGASVRRDDDEKNECFRKYKKVIESYEDHSAFLTGRDRYAFLFDLNKTDYIAWAKGLKKAGYATNPKYPDMLIKIIEDNELYLLDEYALARNPDSRELPSAIIEDNYEYASNNNTREDTEPVERGRTFVSIKDEVRMSENDIPYIVVQDNVSLEALAREHNIKTWEIYTFNDVDKNDKRPPAIGQRIYLDNKRFKCKRNTDPHIVRKGESMYDISQLYGIRLNALYRLNRMDKGTQPQAGTSLTLRKRIPREQLSSTKEE